jgi:hypothetical protein
MKKWVSKANWERKKYPNGVEKHGTIDHHDTKEAAQSVCNLLLKDYSRHTPCEFRGVCVEAWVEENR